ncbi:MAG: hypothetical protein OEX81_02935 [Candidatus Pacebacteria bacterium]|nr:hypothetical protein [Candidatus Paceibacterota bacterium]
MSIIKKLSFSFFVIFLSIFIFVSPVEAADNNDSSFPVCDVTISGVAAGPGNNVRFDPTRQEGNRYYYPIRVCTNFDTINGDQEDSVSNCLADGNQLRVAINTSPFYWRKFEISTYDDGCYLGEINAKNGDAWTSSGVDIDIELANNRGNCREGMPVCRRFESSFERSLDNVETESVDPGTYDICDSNLEHNIIARDNCRICYGNKGIWTAIGCIDQDPKSMVAKLLNIGVGIIGGVFLIRVLAAAFMLTSSQGDVKKTSEAKQMVTEAIIGIIFILFSVTLLQFIGSGILKIPGFG